MIEKRKKILNPSFRDKVNYGSKNKAETIDTNKNKKRHFMKSWNFNAQNNLKKNSKGEIYLN